MAYYRSQMVIQGLGSADLNNFFISELLDVTHWRLTEEAAVFAIELTDALVSDLEGHS